MKPIKLSLVLAAAAALPVFVLDPAPAPAVQAVAEEASTLGIGDPAPAYVGGEFVKGEPVTEFESGKVYVLEFWATWCGPCIAAIPHVTELQEKYEDDGVVIIGQNIWENDESAVVPFVEEMGDRMNYRVALDDDGAMARTFMQAAGQNGIPCSFIIDREGRIAWIGHPMAMDGPLAQVVAGEWDMESAKADAQRARAAEGQMMELQQRFAAAEAAGDTDAMIEVLDEVAAMQPAMAGQIASAKAGLLADAGRGDEAAAVYEQVIETSDDPQVLNDLAWSIVMPAADEPEPAMLAVAASAAEKANDLSGGEDAAVLDTLARVRFREGSVAEAVELQQKAVDLADDDVVREELEATLAEYQAAQ